MRNRIPALDGVRALACLSVIFFHCHVPGSSGGWVGVDVFFVLSGFLITALLAREIEESGGLDLPTFYIRRAARLYPALLLTAAGCLIASWVGKQEVLRAVTYTMNLFAASGKPLTVLSHTWSLAVEEQFYLLWPLVLIVVRCRRRLVGVCLTAGAASIVVGVVSQYPFQYFSPLTRVYELLAGALVALIPALRLRWALLPGMAVLAVTLILTERLVWGHVAGMAAATTAGFLIVSGCVAQDETRLGRVLAWQPAVWIGQRSYGLYLFHAPVSVMILQRSAWHIRTPAVVAISLSAAALSFVLLEVPSRRLVDRLLARYRPRVVRTEATQAVPA